MNRIRFSAVAIVLILAGTSSSFAIGLGGRDSAMAGAYTALTNDSTAAFYNPAGIVNSGLGKVNFALGTSNLGQFTDIYNAVSQGTTFIQNNFNKSIAFNGDFNGIVGFNVAKFGFSLIPQGSATGSKAAGASSFSYSGTVTEDLGVTFGSEVKTPFLPLGNLAAGATVKYILGQRYQATYASSAGNEDTLSANGFGLDLGAQARLSNIVSAGVAVRNLFASQNWSGTRQPKTIDGTGKSSNAGAATPLSFSEPRSVTIATGIAATIPGVGATAAAEIASSDGGGTVSLGFEYPILPMGLLVARAGYGSSNTSSLATFGAGFNAGPAHVDATYGFDSKKNNASSVVVEASFGL